MATRPIARDDDMARTGAPVVASRRISRREVPHGPVVHSHAALAFYLGGHSRMQQRVAWTLGAGDVLLVPAGEPHHRLDANEAEYWGLSLCAPCFATDGAADLLEPFERVRDGAAAVVHIPGPRQEFLGGLFQELARVGEQARQPGETLDAVRRSLLTLILNEVEQAAGASASWQVAGKSVVADSLRFIERNCLKRLMLEDVARAVRRTPAYVTSALTHTTGRSAGEWIVAGRMAEARRLLLHSDEMVDVIAGRVGYADATHFIRMFRRTHGATPTAWRAQQLQRLRAASLK